MKNKLLVKLIVPNLMREFEIFIPANERISKVKELLVKSIVDLIDSDFDSNKIYSLIDPDNGTIYDSRLTIRETNIVNSKRLVLF